MHPLMYVDLFDSDKAFPASTWGPMPAELAPLVRDAIEKECLEAGCFYRFQITPDSRGCTPSSRWAKYLNIPGPSGLPNE